MSPGFDRGFCYIHYLGVISVCMWYASSFIIMITLSMNDDLTDDDVVVMIHQTTIDDVW